MDAQIVKVLYGSRLFGCAIPSSDCDYKLIHLESLRDLLFKDTHAVNSKSGEGADKVEVEDFSLRFYLSMLAKGQVIATDMFFAPESHLTFGNREIWEGVKKLKPYIITQQVGPFMGYSRSQAWKYSNKGAKLLTVQAALRILNEVQPKPYAKPLSEDLQLQGFDRICSELRGMEGISFTDENLKRKGVQGVIRHIVICGKSFGETTSFDLWLGPLTELEKSYGERARLSTTGLDVKAQYHCVRICREAIELLTTGELVFPRPEADLLLKIRSGQMPEDQIRATVDENMLLLETAYKTSSLPQKPDWIKINDFIYDVQSSFLASTR